MVPCEVVGRDRLERALFDQPLLERGSRVVEHLEQRVGRVRRGGVQADARALQGDPDGDVAHVVRDDHHGARRARHDRRYGMVDERIGPGPPVTERLAGLLEHPIARHVAGHDEGRVVG